MSFSRENYQVMRWLRSLIGALRPGRRIVGTDLDGNTYIESNPSRGGRPRREVLTKLKHSQYEDGSIPIEWEAWIRGKRDEPPTHEELLKKMQQREVIKHRAKVLEEEEKERMKEIEKNSLHGWTAPLGQYVGPSLYQKLEETSQPTRTGDSFQPGAWVPSQGGRGQTQDAQQQSSDENNKDTQPTAWTSSQEGRSKDVPYNNSDNNKTDAQEISPTSSEFTEFSSGGMDGD